MLEDTAQVYKLTDVSAAGKGYEVKSTSLLYRQWVRGYMCSYCPRRLSQMGEKYTSRVTGQGYVNHT